MNKGLELSIKFKPHADNSVDYPNNIIMNKNAKKMYVAPSIKEHVVELEQGIAAGSQVAQPGNGSATINDTEGTGGSGWDTSGF
ncbi:hypothetical protein [Sphingobacterium multivorum]|uniref:hypothetical protein n=1 Tax=Sphingobacterium multivorum TaxID=28454 RepID=UPI0031BAE4D8